MYTMENSTERHPWKTVCLVMQAVADNRRTYVLVNNRTEVKAPSHRRIRGGSDTSLVFGQPVCICDQIDENISASVQPSRLHG